MRAQEFLKKRSTENLDEGVIDFISKSKDKFLRLKDALSDEWAQTKEMWEIVQKRKTAKRNQFCKQPIQRYPKSSRVIGVVCLAYSR